MSQEDPRELPRYNLPDAAAYVRVKVPTLETWVRGRGKQSPLIHRPVKGDSRLSYNNLIEAYVLGVARRFGNVSMPRVRQSLEHMREKEGIERFLLHPDLHFRLGNLVWKDDDGLLRNPADGGQVEISEVVKRYLNRIDYRDGWPVGFYPVTRPKHPDGPKRVVIDARIAFGRPVTKHGYIATAMITSRFDAGESVRELADDYDLEETDIEEAIRAEGRLRAA